MIKQDEFYWISIDSWQAGDKETQLINCNAKRQRDMKFKIKQVINFLDVMHWVIFQIKWNLVFSKFDDNEIWSNFEALDNEIKMWDNHWEIDLG